MADGSIPASAGEPLVGGYSLHRGRVYPRKRGGTCVPPGPGQTPLGLSPQARGNPRWSIHPWERCGSIPASAGEPN